MIIILQRIREKRKSAHPASDIIPVLLRLWNELRERKTPVERKKAIVDEILKKAGSRLQEIALRHDTARVIQGCVKFGSTEQKRVVTDALKGKYLELAKAKHGHQTVDRILVLGNLEAKNQVAKELKGNVVRLATHSLGAKVINTCIMKCWSASVSWSLYQELFGQEYIHFKELTDKNARKDLKSFLQAFPTKTKAILDSIYFTLSRISDKNLLTLPLAHRLLADYMSCAPPEHITAMLNTIRDQIIHLVATKEGARAACLAFAYGTARERKLLLRGLRTHMLDIACQAYGHQVLIAALMYTDDTKESGKAIFSELKPHLAFLACHKYGKYVLLTLLAPYSTRYFSQYDLSLVEPKHLPAYLVKRNTSETAPPKPKVSDNDEDGDGQASSFLSQRVAPSEPSQEILDDATAMAPTPTSRKPLAIRRNELLVQIKDELISVCLTHTAVLIRSRHGALVLQETAALWGESTVDENGILHAIASLVMDEPDPEVVAEQVEAMNIAAAQASAAYQDKTHPAHTGLKLPEEGPEPSKSVKSTVFDGGNDNDEVDTDELEGAGSDQDEEMNEDVEESEESDVEEDDDEEDEEEEEDEKAKDLAEQDAEKAEDYQITGGALLPILEHSPSHLVYKRLLAREAKERKSNNPPKRQKDTSNPNYILEPSLTKPEAPIFGRLLYNDLKGNVADFIVSNRAAFVIVELISSVDEELGKAVAVEIIKDRQVLETDEELEGKPGLKVLLEVAEGILNLNKDISTPSKKAKLAQSTPNSSKQPVMTSTPKSATKNATKASPKTPKSAKK